MQAEGGKVRLEEGDEEELKRRSMNKKMNKEKKRLIKYFKERGWSTGIVNGRIKSDEKRNWTIVNYTGDRRKSVINYVLMNEEMNEKVNLEIEEQVDSDHHSTIVCLKNK